MFDDEYHELKASLHSKVINEVDLEGLNRLKEETAREFPDEGSRIGIEHVKLDGRIIHLGEAQIVEMNENGRLKLLRTFTRPGIFDGLGTREEPGDYAVTELKLGDWSLRTRYIPIDSVCKGTYTNLNTPIELYPEKIRYVDLEIDVLL